MKQTAVEFLADNFHYYYSTKWNDILEQAKELEKQQIIDAYLKDRPKATIDKALVYWDKAEKYYNKTFNK